MKKKALLIAMLITGSNGIYAQGTKKEEHPKKRVPSGYMGLWDMNLSAGYIGNKEHHTYNATDYEDRKANGMFLMMHIQESVLSNYIWAMQSDKKIKFGITETLDVGGSYLFDTKTNVSGSGPSENNYETKTKYFGFLFTYEAGAGVVYKINTDMDAGFNYYAFVLSSFTPNHHYAKFRFRYTNYMCELSAFGKTGIDLKYMKASGFKHSDRRERESSSYFGVSLFRDAQDQPLWNNSHSFIYFNYGFIF